MVSRPGADIGEQTKAFAADPALPLEDLHRDFDADNDDAPATVGTVTGALKDGQSQILPAGDAPADGQHDAVNGTFAAMSLAAARSQEPPDTPSTQNSGAPDSEAVPDDPRFWRSEGWSPRVRYSAQRVTPSTVGVHRVLVDGDARLALTRTGVDAATARSAARALAVVAPAALDRRTANVELVHGRTEDGKARLLTATILDGSSRRQVWWFAPRGQPEGFFDDHGNRLGDTGMELPIAGSHISSPFGTRLWGRWTAFHNGIDIAGNHGTPILAAADGVVDYSGWYHDYGKTVRIVHSDSLATSYSHMSDFAPGVGPGTRMRRGEVVGYVGSTGRSTGPHLHFCVLVEGRFVDPVTYLAGHRERLSAPDLASFREWQRATADMASALGTNPRTSLPNGLRRD